MGGKAEATPSESAGGTSARGGTTGGEAALSFDDAAGGVLDWTGEGTRPAVGGGACPQDSTNGRNTTGIRCTKVLI
jgi:hypothetical protein